MAHAKPFYKKKSLSVQYEHVVKLGLSESEQLDCAGIVKRLGGKKSTEQFTPFSRVLLPIVG
jgi:hypothetical protein